MADKSHMIHVKACHHLSAPECVRTRAGSVDSTVMLDGICVTDHEIKQETKCVDTQKRMDTIKRNGGIGFTYCDTANKKATELCWIPQCIVCWQSTETMYKDAHVVLCDSENCHAHCGYQINKASLTKPQDNGACTYCESDDHVACDNINFT